MLKSKSSATEPVTPETLARDFLVQSSQFQLGHLPTETRHPRTTQLSQLAQTNLKEAVGLLKDVELEAMRSLLTVLPFIDKMSEDIAKTLAEGGRIFLCGCGATGRLSLSLETLWREEMIRISALDLVDKVVSFMAGGDYAMVRSIENFEDHPEFGARQLNDLNFTQNDLMIGTTEGGETPFVIGAVEEAARISKRKPYILFCNPSDILIRTVERSRNIIENSEIHSIAIETGPMALAGSTRLQATTALMLATGAALFSAAIQKSSPKSSPNSSIESTTQPQNFINEFFTTLRSVDLSVLIPLIEAESDVYKNGDFCIHRTDRYAISVLTDTTERSPTFSLHPFENVLDPHALLAWTYLVHSGSAHGTDAWTKVLGRKPRPLGWPGFKEKFGEASLLGFDFSPKTIDRRKERAGSSKLHIFDIKAVNDVIYFNLDGIEANIPRARTLLCEHLILKIALNISSTLTMGRLERFSGNLMLYVRAANNKLVDRAIRYVRILLEDHGITEVSYNEVCLTLFQISHGLPFDEPAVWRTFEKLRNAHSAGNKIS